jgi:hypothetical protein
MRVKGEIVIGPIFKRVGNITSYDTAKSSV